MSQNIQELINKIKQDGLEAAQKKAQEIETAAQKKADGIVSGARAEAEKIVADAQARQKQFEESSRASLKQAARDMVLSLKQAIHALLGKIVEREVRETLNREETAALIVDLVKDLMVRHPDAAAVEVGVSEENRARLGEVILAKLKEEIKAGVTVRTSDDLIGGFTISFDNGKSFFDFSEDALAAYLGKFVNEDVADLLKG